MENKRQRAGVPLSDLSYHQVPPEYFKTLGESQILEFKRSLSLQREAFQDLCAMLNAEPSRGTVVFGISPDGEISGVEPGSLDKAQRTLTLGIRQRFQPPLMPTIEILLRDGKHLVKLDARRPPNVTYYECDSVAFIREGSVTRSLSLDEKHGLTRYRDRAFHPGPWKCNRCGTVVGMLVQMVFSESGAQKSYDCNCGGEFWPIR
jgi:hypothetical protein